MPDGEGKEDDGIGQLPHSWRDGKPSSFTISEKLAASRRGGVKRAELNVKKEEERPHTIGDALRGDFVAAINLFVYQGCMRFDRFRLVWAERRLSVVHNTVPRRCDPIHLLHSSFATLLGLLMKQEEDPSLAQSNHESERMSPNPHANQLAPPPAGPTLPAHDLGPGSLPFQIGVLYALYSLHGTQAIRPPVPIPVDARALLALHTLRHRLKAAGPHGTDALAVLERLANVPGNFRVAAYPGPRSLAHLDTILLQTVKPPSLSVKYAEIRERIKVRHEQEVVAKSVAAAAGGEGSGLRPTTSRVTSAEPGPVGTGSAVRGAVDAVRRRNPEGVSSAGFDASPEESRGSKWGPLGRAERAARGVSHRLKKLSFTYAEYESMLEKSRARGSGRARGQPPSARGAGCEGDSRGTLSNGDGDKGDARPEPTGNRIAHFPVGKRIEGFIRDLGALLDCKDGERFPISDAYGLQGLFENPPVPRRSSQALSSTSTSSFADLPPLPAFPSAPPANKRSSTPGSSSRAGSRANLPLTSDKKSSLTETSSSIPSGDKPNCSARHADGGGSDAPRYPRGRNVRNHILAVQRELEEEEERERNAQQGLRGAVVPSPPKRSVARTSGSLPGMSSGRQANALPGMGSGKQTNTLPGMGTANSLIEGGSRDFLGLGNISKDSRNREDAGSSDDNSNRRRANDAEESRRVAEKVPSTQRVGPTRVAQAKSNRRRTRGVRNAASSSSEGEGEGSENDADVYEVGNGSLEGWEHVVSPGVDHGEEDQNLGGEQDMALSSRRPCGSPTTTNLPSQERPGQAGGVSAEGMGGTQGEPDVASSSEDEEIADFERFVKNITSTCSAASSPVAHGSSSGSKRPCSNKRKPTDMSESDSEVFPEARKKRGSGSSGASSSGTYPECRIERIARRSGGGVSAEDERGRLGDQVDQELGREPEETSASRSAVPSNAASARSESGPGEPEARRCNGNRTGGRKRKGRHDDKGQQEDTAGLASLVEDVSSLPGVHLSEATVSSSSLRTRSASPGCKQKISERGKRDCGDERLMAKARKMPATDRPRNCSRLGDTGRGGRGRSRGAVSGRGGSSRRRVSVAAAEEAAAARQRSEREAREARAEKRMDEEARDGTPRATMSDSSEDEEIAEFERFVSSVVTEGNDVQGTELRPSSGCTLSSTDADQRESLDVGDRSLNTVSPVANFTSASTKLQPCASKPLVATSVGSRSPKRGGGSGRSSTRGRGTSVGSRPPKKGGGGGRSSTRGRGAGEARKGRKRASAAAVEEQAAARLRADQGARAYERESRIGEAVETGAQGGGEDASSVDEEIAEFESFVNNFSTSSLVHGHQETAGAGISPRLPTDSWPSNIDGFPLEGQSSRGVIPPKSTTSPGTVSSVAGAISARTNISASRSTAEAAPEAVTQSGARCSSGVTTATEKGKGKGKGRNSVTSGSKAKQASFWMSRGDKTASTVRRGGSKSADSKVRLVLGEEVVRSVGGGETAPREGRAGAPRVQDERSAGVAEKAPGSAAAGADCRDSEPPPSALGGLEDRGGAPTGGNSDGGDEKNVDDPTRRETGIGAEAANGGGSDSAEAVCRSGGKNGSAAKQQETEKDAEAIGSHEASAALGGGHEHLPSDTPAVASASRAGHDGNNGIVTSEEVSAERNETRSRLGDGGMVASGREHQQEIIGGDTSSDSEDE